MTVYSFRNVRVQLATATARAIATPWSLTNSKNRHRSEDRNLAAASEALAEGPFLLMRFLGVNVEKKNLICHSSSAKGPYFVVFATVPAAFILFESFRSQEPEDP
ncbi:hypothetical protein ARMGADRAFT_789930 [Armillaria gallica]|uniref:Uncharacterized protein n=1 Tax=Armillaria gallica TaxID=47427 RepID=A0A2H3DJ11_ARMGA|nr:hypothetical protein ARMGADRAFT_789930 [Armillaria gallica]